jgi:hypothetical protein
MALGSFAVTVRLRPRDAAIDDILDFTVPSTEAEEAECCEVPRSSVACSLSSCIDKSSPPSSDASSVGATNSEQRQLTVIIWKRTL